MKHHDLNTALFFLRLKEMSMSKHTQHDAARRFGHQWGRVEKIKQLSGGECLLSAEDPAC